MKTLLALVILAAIAAGGGWWYYEKQKAGNVITYTTTTVTKDSITQMVTATGTLNPVVNVQVGSQISGNIKELLVDFNSPVKKGQVVAQLNPSTYQAIVAQQEGEVTSAKANLELARITSKRKKELVALNAAPQADLDAAQADLAQAEAQLLIKTANLEKARVDLGYCTIYSPIDGTVITRDVDVGQTVAASMSAPILFTIANDLAKMQINAAVAEADVGMVEEKQNVNFTVDAFPYRTFKGIVTQVRNAATTTNNVVTYDVIISVDNADLKLKPGMTANVSVIVAHRDDSLKVPNAALRFRPQLPAGSDTATTASSQAGRPGSGPGQPGGGSRQRRRDSSGGDNQDGSGVTQRTVYLLKDGKPEATSIKTGISDSISTEVLEGLNEGDLVISGQSGGASSFNAATAPNNPFRGGGPGGRRF